MAVASDSIRKKSDSTGSELPVEGKMVLDHFPPGAPGKGQMPSVGRCLRPAELQGWRAGRWREDTWVTFGDHVGHSPQVPSSPFIFRLESAPAPRNADREPFPIT